MIRCTICDCSFDQDFGYVLHGQPICDYCLREYLSHTSEEKRKREIAELGEEVERMRMNFQQCQWK